MKKLSFLIIVAILGIAISAQAQTWTQEGNTIAGDTENEQFGWSISLSADGQILSIGRPYNNNGSVSIYENIDGTWTQIGQALDGEEDGDTFGCAVSTNADGSIVAIGAQYSDSNGSDAGAVKVYKNQEGTWTQIGNSIVGDESNEHSGVSLSINDDGTVVAIGAEYNSEGGLNAGAARIYENINGNWTKIGQTIIGDDFFNYYGNAISINANGSIVAIAGKANGAAGNAAGHVQIYQNQNGTWEQIGEDIYGEAEMNNSGYSISINSDGNIVAIGAPYNSDNGNYAGHVRVYENQNGTWTQIGQDLDGEAAEDKFGYSVSINGDGTTLAVGAATNCDNGQNAGSAYIYQYQNETWVLIEDIEGEDAHEKFGSSVSISAQENIVAVGAPFSPTTGNVRVFSDNTVNVNKIITDNYISIFPNPSNGTFTIQNNELQIKNIEIIDITGKVIHNQQFVVPNSQFSIKEKGVYLIKLQTENNIYTQKLIIQ